MQKEKRKYVERFMKAFCKKQYGDADAIYKFIPIPQCRHYVLTEYGDLISFRHKGTLVKGMKNKGRKNKAGRHWRSGFVVDQFYKPKLGTFVDNQTGELVIKKMSQRFMTISRAKLMLMTFKGYSLAKARKVSVFPADKNNSNLHIENLLDFKNFYEGALKVYGIPNKGSLKDSNIRAIRKSKKTNKQPGQKYDRNFHTISRIRNRRSYQNVI